MYGRRRQSHRRDGLDRDDLSNERDVQTEKPLAEPERADSARASCHDVAVRIAGGCCRHGVWWPQLPYRAYRRMMSRSDCGVKGFATWSSAPWRLPQKRSLSVPLLVTSTTGIFAVSGSLLSARVVLKP